MWWPLQVALALTFAFALGRWSKSWTPERPPWIDPKVWKKAFTDYRDSRP